MAQTVVDLEDRHQKELEALQNSLQEKEEKCRELEAQIEEIIKHQGMLIPPQDQSPVASPDSKPVKLRQSDAQSAILAGALDGLGGDEDDDDNDDDDENMSLPQNGGTGSYAAFAEYAARMKAQTVELDSLKRRLAESELAREDVTEELAESRNAKEKLPLFEAKVQELTAENREMSLEIQGLQEDIAEVRELYRSQLNSLLEEKTACPNDNGSEL
jgi:chromosome segregation ATPase